MHSLCLLVRIVSGIFSYFFPSFSFLYIKGCPNDRYVKPITQDCWTYQNGPYEPRTPPPVEGREMLRFSDVGPDGQPLADIPLPTESPKTPEHLSFRAGPCGYGYMFSY